MHLLCPDETDTRSFWVIPPITDQWSDQLAHPAHQKKLSDRAYAASECDYSWLVLFEHKDLHPEFKQNGTIDYRTLREPRFREQVCRYFENTAISDMHVRTNEDWTPMSQHLKDTVRVEANVAVCKLNLLLETRGRTR